MKYRTKPVVVDAMRWNGDQRTLDRFLVHTAPRRPDRTLISSPGGHITIRTFEGDMRCQIGDYLIRGVKGELYPCKPDIFEATYEAVMPE